MTNYITKLNQFSIYYKNNIFKLEVNNIHKYNKQ